ncbi:MULTISPECIES: hypothetical protein [Rahnella]|uniref:hypothetical protein n=1 Tax=Rahnella TaxID=34037 RepID=UPI000DD3CAAB|nr:hypothetical protein [Rahnella sp. NRRL B-41462]CAH0133472.1 hypothetical protein SRABI106_00046 [Rahnella aquatilis]
MDELKKIFTPRLKKLVLDLFVESAKGLPGVGGMVNASDKLLRGLADIEQEERQKRLKDYALGLAYDYVEDVEFREEEVLTVVRKLVADDEAAKTEYYTRLTLGLGRIDMETLPPKMRYHLIRMTSELTCYQIEFARELKIRKTVPIIGTLSLDEAELKLTSMERGMTLQAVSTLRNWGLIKEVSLPPRAKPPAGQLYDLTQDFHTLMSLLFHPDDFSPLTIDQKPKEIVDVIIVEPYSSADNLYEEYLTSILNREGKKVSVETRGSQHLYEKLGHRYLHTGELLKDKKKFIRFNLTKTGHKSDAETQRTFLIEKELYTRFNNNSSSAQSKLRQKLDEIASAVLE